MFGGGRDENPVKWVVVNGLKSRGGDCNPGGHGQFLQLVLLQGTPPPIFR